MSNKVQGLVWDVTFPTQAQKLIMLKLADHANDEGGSIWPSKSKVAEKVGCSESTVQLVLKVFRDCGLLHVLEPGGAGPRSTTKYAINLPLLQAIAAGRCTITGCSDTLEIDGDFPPEFIHKGSDFDPYKGSAGYGVNPQPVSREANKGSAGTDKGSTGRPQTSIKNHNITFSAHERASDEGARARSAKTVTSRTPVFDLTPIEGSWNEWMRWLVERGHQDIADAASLAGTMQVVGSKWPSESSLLPRVSQSALAKVEAAAIARRTTGEVA